MLSLFPLRLLVVTVLLLAVSAVRVFTSQRKMALSRPALATWFKMFNIELKQKKIHTCSLSFA